MLGDMKKIATLSALALLLTGCAAQPAATPTPSGPDMNVIACRAFANEWPAVFENLSDSTGPEWKKESARIDSIALKAEGDVKERMLSFVENWPEPFDVMTGEIDDINANLAAIERACDAEGTNIDGMQLTEVG